MSFSELRGDKIKVPYAGDSLRFQFYSLVKAVLTGTVHIFKFDVCDHESLKEPLLE
jgi:hypothetical protein